MRRWGRIALGVLALLLALLSAVILALLSAWLLAFFLAGEDLPPYGVGGILISAGTLLVSTVGTISLMRRWGRIALWVLALLLAFLPAVILALLSAWLFAMSLAGNPDYGVGGILISAGTLLVSTVGTISTIWLAWRKERRDSREYTLKIRQLEMQLTELRAKTSSSTPPVAP